MKSAIAALSVAAVAQATSFKIGTIHHDSAPIMGAANADTIADSYIIKFKDHVDSAGADSHHDWIKNIHEDGEQERLELRKRGLFPSSDDLFGGLKHTYNIGDSFRGYAGHFQASTIEQIRNHPDVSPRHALQTSTRTEYPVATQSSGVLFSKTQMTIFY